VYLPANWDTGCEICGYHGGVAEDSGRVGGLVVPDPKRKGTVILRNVGNHTQRNITGLEPLLKTMSLWYVRNNIETEVFMTH
jgi:hypothetical protein